MHSATRLVFLTLVNHCWWTLTCALSLVLSFWHWSVTVGGLWLVRFHSSCLFDIGQSLLVDFDLCAPTHLIFLVLVSHCWWTLSCTLPIVLSFLTWLVFLILVSHCWWTLACAVPLVLSFWQDEWKRTNQSQPTVNDQCQKDKTSGNAKVKVHQQGLTNFKKTRWVGTHKSKSANSGWPMSKW